MSFEVLLLFAKTFTAAREFSAQKKGFSCQRRDFKEESAACESV